MMIYCKNTYKRKPKSKTKAQRLAYESLCKELGVSPYNGRRATKPKTYNVKTYVPSSSVPKRSEEKYSSLNSVVLGAVTTGRQKQVYTGDKLLGIASMHKSNYVPVFSGDEAVSLAKMRRN